VVLAPEEDAPRPDDPSLMPADLPLPDTEPDPDPVTAERLPPPREPLPVPSAPSTRGGDLRSVIAIGNRKAPPVEKPSEPEFDSNPTFEADTSDNANREAATLLRKGLGGGAGGERSLLGSLDPRRVHICQGCYDHVEKVLDLMGIRYDALKPEEVAAAPLAADGLLVIDCGVDRLDADAAASVRRFVEAGGYLCTTDWALENVLEPAFPGVLRSLYKSGRGVSTQKEIVHFRLAAPLHPLVRGLRPVAEGGVWWVEDQAHPIEIADTRRVVVLVESEEFRQRYGSAVLAVTFGWGKGRVLHLLGHAWQREGNLKGTYAMQRMILNFLLERAGTPTAERRETIQK
jgi:hypothetical protein